MSADWLRDTVSSGSFLLAAPLALAAGLVSFFSPCVLPLLPGYLSYVSGLSGIEALERRRPRVVLGSLLFVAGFGSVFVLYGVTAGVASTLIAEQETVNVILGVLAIVLGAVFLGAIPYMQRDVRFMHKLPAGGLALAPVLGVLFGVGWTPCIGPTLGAILTLAYTTGGAARGGVLLAVYAIGLGLPFIAAAFGLNRALVVSQVMRRHQRWLTGLGGVMLILIGVLILTGWWDYLVTWTQTALVNSSLFGL
jgi:cytochrome c-type biogenesis protein